MNYIVLCLLILFCVLGKIIEKTWINLLSVFEGIFAVVVFFASLKLNGLNDFSDKPYFIILTGCTFFLMGYVVQHYSKKRIVLKRHSAEVSSNIRSNFFVFLFWLTFIVWIVLFVIAFNFIRSGVDYSLIRDIYSGINTDYSFSNFAFFNVIVDMVFVPCVYIICCVILNSLFQNRFKWYYYFATLLLVVMYCFTTGSRLLLLVLIIQSVFIIDLRKRSIFDNASFKKIIKLLKRILVIAAVGIICISVARPVISTAGQWNTAKTAYAYGSVSVPLLDYWSNYIDSLGYRAHGFVFVRGLLNVIARFRVPLPSSFSEASQMVSYCADTYIKVFSAKGFNAFLTVFFYFYMDFGYAGVMLGSLFFGYLSSAMYKSVKRNESCRATVYFLLFSISVIKSFARWEFAQSDYIMMFLISFVLFKQGAISDNEE